MLEVQSCDINGFIPSAVDKCVQRMCLVALFQHTSVVFLGNFEHCSHKWMWNRGSTDVFDLVSFVGIHSA